MLVPEDIQRCVCFVYVKVTGRLRPVGTAFFMSTPWWETADGKVIFPGQYLVTALHVVARAEQLSDDAQLSVRINTTTGIGPCNRATTFVDQGRSIKLGGGCRHPGVAAVGEVPNAREELEYASICTKSCVTPEIIAVDIGVGGDLFLTGLFVSHVGKQRNVPIVRTGTIATLPGEPVPHQA